MDRLRRYFDWELLPLRQSLVLRFGVAVILFGGALILRLLLHDLIGSETPFLLFSLATVLSALYGGFYPGLLTAFLGGVAINYFFQVPFGFGVANFTDALELGVYSLLSIFMCLITEVLRITNRRVRHILDSISDAFFALDNRWRFVYLNEQARPFFPGKTRNDLVGENLWEYIPNANKTLLYKKLHESKRTKKSLHFDGHPPGLNRWLEFHTYPSKDGLSVYFTDATTRKELEQRKDDFISIASHELKTPVTIIKVYAQVLEKWFKGRKERDAMKYLSRMDAEVNKLIGLIDDLLDVSKVQSGKMSYDFEEFDLNRLVKDVVEGIGAANRRYRISLEGKVKRKMVGDRGRIGQVLINLLTNAIKYSPSSKKVLVRLVETDNRVVVSVKDFGWGISKEHQKKLFQRFYRVEDKEVRGSVSGLGMGLYISNEIVKRHSGKMWVESEKDKGSEFFFSIPKRVVVGVI